MRNRKVAKGTKFSLVPEEKLNKIFPVKEIIELLEKHGFTADVKTHAFYAPTSGDDGLIVNICRKAQRADKVSAFIAASYRF